MQILLSIVAAFFLTSCLVLLWACTNAVEGYQDEEGFHMGRGVRK
jgi:hypothetical protein